MSTLQPFIDAHLARRDEAKSQATARAHLARCHAETIATHLATQYGVKRVVLIGSLARGEFRLASDIDIVVEGLPVGDLFRAGSEAESLASGFCVDLIPLESANPLLRAAVRNEGVVLYARE